MQELIRYAEKKGAEYVEFKGVGSEKNSIEVQDSEIRDLSYSETNLCSVKVIYKGSEGLAFSSFSRDIGSVDFKKLVDEAVKIAKVFKKDVGPCNLDSIKKRVKTKLKINPRDIDLNVKKKRMLSLSLENRKDYKKISSLQLIYNDIVKNFWFFNSEGRDLVWNDVLTAFRVQAFSKDGNLMESYYDREAGHVGYELMNGGNVDNLVKNTMNMAEKLLKAEHAKGGNFPVVVNPRLAGVFAHEAVGHACEADIVLQGGSVLGEKVGNKIGSENVTIIDSGVVPGCYGSIPFDDEGVLGRKTVLVDKGVLKGFLHNRETAFILKAKPTGNGRAQSPGCRTIPRMTCTYIENEKKKYNLNDLTSGIKYGYYLKDSAGGEVNPSTGEFLFNAQYGYRIRDGKLAEMVKGVSLIGNILEILPKISMIGYDLKHEAGWCGKDGQYVIISTGAPHIKIDLAKVGGR